MNISAGSPVYVRIPTPDTDTRTEVKKKIAEYRNNAVVKDGIDAVFVAPRIACCLVNNLSVSSKNISGN